MIALVSATNDEIALLKANLAIAQTKGPGFYKMQKFKDKNYYISTKVATLKDLLLNHHLQSNTMLTFVVRSLTKNPSLLPRFHCFFLV